MVIKELEINTNNDRLKPIIQKIWKDLNLYENIQTYNNSEAKNFRMNVWFSDDHVDNCHPYHVYSWMSGFDYMSLYMPTSFKDLSDDELEQVLKGAMVGEINDTMKTVFKDNAKPIQCDTSLWEFIVSDHFGSDEYIEKHQKEYLSNHKNYRKTLKNSNKKTIQEYLDKLIDTRLLTKKETEGIEYRWYSGSSGSDILSESRRSMKIVAIDAHYATYSETPEYIIEYALFLGTKLMHFDLCSERNFDTSLKNTITQTYPLADMAERWLDRNIHYRKVDIDIICK